MIKDIQKRIAQAFREYPEIVLFNLFDGAIDCITGERIKKGTRIVTTTYATKKRFNICGENVTMTVENYRSLTNNHNITRSGQLIWVVNTKQNQTYFSKSSKKYEKKDFSDIDKLIGEDK